MFRKLHDPGADAVTITIDGVAVTAEIGETVAAVLLRQTEAWNRTTPVSGSRRAPHCLMGVCFDCLAEVDGVASVQTCLTPVKPGMRVVRQLGRRESCSRRRRPRRDVRRRCSASARSERSGR
jgi:D-hydroxyproline dehydrogenase subunit gamma